MRAIPLMAALLASTPALAQVSEDITHPLIVTPNVTAAVRTAHESPRHDATAFAVAAMNFGTEWWGQDVFGFVTHVRALGEGNTSEALIEAQFTTSRDAIVRWQISGPGMVSLSGPSIDVQTSESSPSFSLDSYECGVFGSVNSNICPGYFLPPGAYQLTLTQSLTSGQYAGTASIESVVAVIPEPSTWAIAAGAVVLLMIHASRRPLRFYRRRLRPSP